MIHLVIPGRPTTKGNSGRIIKHGKRRTFIPSPQSVKAQRSAREHVVDQYRGALLDGPLNVDVIFIFALPQKTKNKEGDVCMLHVDRGNLLKLIEDAMQGVVYVDDAQIVSGGVSKRWGRESLTVVTVTPSAG